MIGLSFIIPASIVLTIGVMGVWYTFLPNKEEARANSLISLTIATPVIAFGTSQWRYAGYTFWQALDETFWIWVISVCLVVFFHSGLTRMFFTRHDDEIE